MRGDKIGIYKQMLIVIVNDKDSLSYGFQRVKILDKQVPVLTLIRISIVLNKKT